VRAGLAGLVERGFAAGFVVEEEGFAPEGPDVVGRGATDERLVGADEGISNLKLCKPVVTYRSDVK